MVLNTVGPLLMTTSSDPRLGVISYFKCSLAQDGESICTVWALSTCVGVILAVDLNRPGSLCILVWPHTETDLVMGTDPSAFLPRVY